MCEDKLKEKTAHFRLPCGSQKTRVLKLPIVCRGNRIYKLVGYANDR